jgi:hypothetical protein
MSGKKKTKNPALRRRFDQPARVYLVTDGLSVSSQWFRTYREAKEVHDAWRAEDVAECGASSQKIISFALQTG